MRQTEYSPLVDKRGIWINALALMILQVMVVASAIKNRYHEIVSKYSTPKRKALRRCICDGIQKLIGHVYLWIISTKHVAWKVKNNCFFLMFSNQEVHVFPSSHWRPITLLLLNWWSKMECQCMLSTFGCF